MRYDQISPIPPLTPITRNLIVLCTVAYFVDFTLFHLDVQFWGMNLNEILGLVPEFVLTKQWYWQFFTYIFMHGHPLHILLNMLILWYFGSEIEMRLGSRQFLQYFLLCGVGAGLFNFGVNVAFADPSRLGHPIIGASGAIFGILAAYGIFFGERMFLVFFLFPMKAKYFVLIMAGIELIMGVESSPRDNVAHFAHVGGMFVGAVYVWLRYVKPWNFRGGQKRKDYEREKLRRQFTLIVNDKEEPKKKDRDDPSYWN